MVRTWGLKGQTPVIESAGGWKNITAAGMITWNSRTKRASSLAWVAKQTMRKEGILAILCALKGWYRRRHLVLVWDGLAAHKAGVVRTFMKENRLWLTVVRFPAYAPELNPQELVWSAVKRRDVGNTCSASLQELHGRVYRSLKRRAKEKDFLKGCLRGSGLWSARELGEG